MKVTGLHFIRKLIKLFIVIGDACMTLHCVLLICGVDLCVMEFLFGLSVAGFVILLLSSYLLGFCNKLRYVLSHGFVVQCCVMWQRMIGFGIVRHPLQLMMVVIGVALLVNLYENDEEFDETYLQSTQEYCGQDRQREV